MLQSLFETLVSRQVEWGLVDGVAQDKQVINSDTEHQERQHRMHLVFFPVQQEGHTKAGEDCDTYAHQASNCKRQPAVNRAARPDEGDDVGDSDEDTVH